MIKFILGYILGSIATAIVFCLMIVGDDKEEE